MYAGGAPDAGGRLPLLRLAAGQVPAADHAAVALGAVQHHLAQREARLLHCSRAGRQRCSSAAGVLGSREHHSSWAAGQFAQGDAQRVQAPAPRSLPTAAAVYLQCCDHACQLGSNKCCNHACQLGSHCKGSPGQRYCAAASAASAAAASTSRSRSRSAAASSYFSAAAASAICAGGKQSTVLLVAKAGMASSRQPV